MLRSHFLILGCLLSSFQAKLTQGMTTLDDVISEMSLMKSEMKQLSDEISMMKIYKIYKIYKVAPGEQGLWDAFQEADEDADGKLDFEEFKGTVSNTTSVDEQDIDYKTAYISVNIKNGNGNLSIWMTKAFLINDPKTYPDITGSVMQCKDWYSELPKDIIAVIDFGDLLCGEKILLLEQEGNISNNIKAIIFLENWDIRSNNSYPDMVGKTADTPTQTITKIKSQTKVPIFSISNKDKEYFKAGLNLAKSKDYTLGIFFQSLKSLLEDNSYTPSPLFHYSNCIFDKGEGCLHYFSNTTKLGENFLGCNGEPKKRVIMDIRCKSDNEDCPELLNWKRTPPRKELQECAIKEGSLDPNNIYRSALTCKQKEGNDWDYFDLTKASCLEEDIGNQFWMESVDFICTDAKKWQKSHPNCGDDAKCRKWGRWSTFSECEKSGKRGYRKVRNRFCTDITSEITPTHRCVIVEEEEFMSRHQEHNCNEMVEC